MRALLTALLTFCVLLPFTTRLRLGIEPDERPRVELLEAERELMTSMDSRDTETAGALLNDQVRIVDADGDLLDRAGALTAVRDGTGSVGVSLRDPDLRFYDNVALVHGRSHRRSAEMYVLRAWVRQEGRWKLTLAHSTDITKHASADPPAFATLEAPVPAQPTDEAPDEAVEEVDVRHTLRESHRRYWAKDVDGYLRTVGVDLIRAAETGVRPGSELVAFMRDSPHLPRPPSQQLEMWATVFGNVAIGGWLDAGTTAHGAVSRNRFTMALVWRDGRWQIVQMQSTGVSGATRQSAVPATSRQPHS